ncbi:MAG TPA: DUF2339 domain-containing protein [Thermoanaerobaculia bacterium]|nr:DUF2339 domain-containing protein [Thermoanaerobaculia bacterium]
MSFPEILLAVGTVLLVAGGFLLRTRWTAHGEVLVWAAVAALFVSLACAVFLFRSLPLLAGATFLGLAASAAMALLGVRRGMAAALLASLGAFVAVIGIAPVEDAVDLLLPGGLLVLVGIAATWKRGSGIGPLLAGGGFFLVVASDLGEIIDGSPGELIGMAVLTAAAFVLARLEPRIEGIAWIVSGMVLPLLGVRPVVAGGESPATLLAGGVLLAGAAYGAGWGAPRPARWTALSALAGVTFLLLAVSRYGEYKWWWSGLALTGAALSAGLALLTARRQTLSAAAPLAAASVLFSAFAVTLELGRGWPGVGFALAVPLLVWLFPKLPSQALRSLALGLAALSVLWLWRHGEDFGSSDGGAVDLPWFLYGYGIPLLAMLLAGWLARRQGETRVADRLEWAALGFTLLLVVFSVRQLRPEKSTVLLVLVGLAVILAFGVFRASRRPRGRDPRVATAGILLVAVLGATGAEAAGLEGEALASSWRIRAPGAKPGDLVRLEIPEEIHARSLGYFGWLSLVADGRALPYGVSLSSEPVTAVRLQRARPRPEPELRVSRIDLALTPGVRLASLRLTTTSPPFSRKVLLAAEQGPALAELDWICRSQGPRPCRLETESLTIPWWPALHERARTPRLSLVFLDGENPPLPAVDVEIRRWKEALLFIWPQDGPVDLLVGPCGSDEPVSAHVDLPEKGPWRPALLAPAEPKSSASAFILSGAVLLGLLGWRVRERLSGPQALPMVLLMMLAGTSGLVAAEGRLHTRPVDVPAKGPVRVPLDLAALRHLGADGEGVRVFGPDGQEVPSRMETFFQKIEPPSISAATQSGGRDKQGFVIEVAPGQSSTSYDQIFLVSRNRNFGATPGVRVEGSDNGRGWHPLGNSDLFEVWREEGWRSGDHQVSMLLPPSGYRFVRVLPSHHFGWTEVASLPGRTASWTVERPECRRDADLTVCVLRLPARGQRPLRLILEMADRRDLGLRLLAAEEGAWKPLVQGVSRPVSGARHVVPLGVDLPLGTRTLRLELGTKGAPARLVRAILPLAQPVAVFEAPRPGRYRLAYGGGGGLQLREDNSVPDDAAWIEPGPESAGELPSLPGRLIRPKVPLRGDFAFSWTVESRGASPGEVVRLEIPDEVYARSLPDLADVRLHAGGWQIPFVRRNLDEPARVVEVRRSRLEKRFLGVGSPRLDIRLPQPRLPLTTYRLTAPPDSGPIEEWPSLSLVPADWRPGWYCRPQPLLPCQFNGATRGVEDRAFAPVVTIEDLQIPTFDVSVWRRREALVFVWPEGGPVRLVAGDRERGAPSYDLALIESQILARPWRPASLGSRDVSVSWLRLPLVALAGGALLGLLRRKLPIAPPPGQG